MPDVVCAGVVASVESWFVVASGTSGLPCGARWNGAGCAVFSNLVMTTLRFHRAQILVTAAFLAVLLALMITHARASAASIVEYRAGICPGAGCDDITALVDRHYQEVGRYLSLLGLLPAAIGALWGAPLLAREFETGTIKLILTQSVSRRWWILTTMVVLGVLVAIGGALVGTVTDYWLSVFQGFELPGTTASDASLSEIRGAAPVGWWLFGFTLGAFVGAVLQRTVRAIAGTIVAVVAALVVSNLLTRFDPEAPLHLTVLPWRILEPAVLITAAVLLTTATCWSVVHARA